MEDEEKHAKPDFEAVHKLPPKAIEEVLIQATTAFLCAGCTHKLPPHELCLAWPCDTHDRVRHRLEGLLT